MEDSHNFWFAYIKNISPNRTNSLFRASIQPTFHNMPKYQKSCLFESNDYFIWVKRALSPQRSKPHFTVKIWWELQVLDVITKNFPTTSKNFQQLSSLLLRCLKGWVEWQIYCRFLVKMLLILLEVWSRTLKSSNFNWSLFFLLEMLARTKELLLVVCARTVYWVHQLLPACSVSSCNRQDTCWDVVKVFVLGVMIIIILAIFLWWCFLPQI